MRITLSRAVSAAAGLVFSTLLLACTHSTPRDAGDALPSWQRARTDATTTPIDGMSIRYRRSERAGAPSVILLGPYPQSIRAWDSAWPALAERYDLLAMDLPGFGLSEGTPEVMSPSAAGRIVVETADHFGIGRFHIVGPDVGAPVALWLAATHPDRVSSANVFDGPGDFPPDMEPQLDQLVRSGLYRWMAAHVVAGAAMDQFYEIATESGYTAARPSDAAATEYHAITHNPSSHRLALAYLASYERELSELGARLTSIETPILITWGRDDAFVLPSNGERLNALLPASELVIFDDAGHYSHEDAGDRYLEILTEWIDRGHRTARLSVAASRPGASGE